MNKKDTIITIIVVTLCAALVAGIIVYKNLGPEDVTTTVAHDHDGDGVADHDDSYHETTKPTVAHDHDGDGVADHDASYHETTGNTNSANQEDGDIDVNIEDLPNASGNTEAGSGTGN